jgi:gliding motility-associated-like protein
VTLNPGGTIRTGSGPNTVVSDLSAGIHSFTVTSSEGCTSSSSASVVINAQPEIPAAPVAKTIIQPDCQFTTGSVDLNGLPSTGNWILTRYPGSFTLSGTGSGTTISDLPPGIYNFSVTNADLCTSITSANVVISNSPAVPTPPVAGTIVHPTCIVPTGRVELTGLPSTGTWTLTRAPDGITSTGTGTSTIVTDLSSGIYFFTVINSVGCISLASQDVIINPGPATAAILKVTNPMPVCYPVTLNLTDASITTGSSPGLVYTYWRDSKATMPYNTPATATDGTYYIKGTNTLGCFDIKPVIVKVFQLSTAAAGPDQDLEYVFGTILEARDPGIYETGVWSVGSGTAEFVDSVYARTSVSELSIGENKLLWTVSNGICPPSKDSVTITVHNLLITTLVTPNGDSNNEYFIIKGIEALGKSELKIFDRRGKQLYVNENYDNRWNGVDFNGDPLPADTYFFGLKTQKGEYIKGYIVVRYNAEK